jgi:Domain of unknown function (DUF4932)
MKRMPFTPHAQRRRTLFRAGLILLTLSFLHPTGIAAVIAGMKPDSGPGEARKVWLVIKKGGRQLEIAPGYNIKMDGGGKLKFSKGGRIIELPEALTVLVNEKAVSGESRVYEGETVRITDQKGQTVWTLRPLPANEPSPFSRPPFTDDVKNEVKLSAASVSLTMRPTFKITVDPRVELLSIVQVLGGYGLANEDMTPYRRNVEAYFARYKNHTAVKMYAEMSAKGFAWEVPSEAMIYLSDPPQLNPRLPFSSKIKQRAGGEQSLEQFLTALRDFARETKFADFYEANKGVYLHSINDTRTRLSAIDYAGAMESYFGMKQPSYTLMLAPLSKEVGFASNIKRDDGARDIYGVIGRSSVKDSNYVFGEGGDLSLQHFVWHEFGHSFVNPLTEKHREAVTKYAALLNSLSDQVKKPYRTWEQVVNEHVIRAITSRLAYHQIGREAGEKELQEHKSAGFIYVEALYERLKEYEAQRSKYRTLDEFYPRLIDVFREASEKSGIK